VRLPIESVTLCIPKIRKHQKAASFNFCPFCGYSILIDHILVNAPSIS